MSTTIFDRAGPGRFDDLVDLPDDGRRYEVGLIVEIVSPSSRKTDRFSKPGSTPQVAIPLFWRVETEPAVVIFAYRLEGTCYVESRSRGVGRGVHPSRGETPS